MVPDSLSSALQAKASSIRHNVKGLRPNISISKKGSGHQHHHHPQQQSVPTDAASAVGDKEEPVPLPDSEAGKSKNVVWEDEDARARKEEKGVR